MDSLLFWLSDGRILWWAFALFIAVHVGMKQEFSPLMGWVLFIVSIQATSAALYLLMDPSIEPTLTGEAYWTAKRMNGLLVPLGAVSLLRVILLIRERMGEASGGQ